MTMPRRPRVAILGAGAAGLCIGVSMQRLGLDFTIYEKRDGVGGTWRANTYPGAACDVPSNLYSFSFAPKRDWGRRFPEQPEILAYFEAVADDFGLRPHLRLGIEVCRLTFDDESAVWTLDLAGGEQAEADIVISGLGQLHRPFIPSIAGIDSFAGPLFHSAQWRHDCDLTGRRVAVIGSGASAIQFVPPVAAMAEHLTIFQRSANWIIPKPDRVIEGWRRWLLEHVGATQKLSRWSTYWRLELNYRLILEGSLLGRLIKWKATPELERMVTDSVPRDALVPDYSPGCKRVLISNDWYTTLLRRNVSVELSPIDHIDTDGIVTSDGAHHIADAIVLGTGFQTTEFLAPMSVIGHHGLDLNDAWERGAEAYLGISVAGFPNFFMLYGPNTNLGHNSIIFMIESQARYISNAIAHMIEHDLDWIDVRPDVMDTYNSQIQRNAADTVWAGSCSSWYKNDEGRITNNWPLSSFGYWRRTRHFWPGDFARHPRRIAVKA